MIPVNIEKDKVDYVVIFANWLLTGATVAIAYYAVQQVRLAKAMFVSTFRPKLIIRGIILIRDDRAWQLKYLVANVGGTAAYITESNLTTVHIELVEDKLPTFPPYTADRDSLGRFIVKPGEYKEQLLQLDPWTDAFKFAELRECKGVPGVGAGTLYCLGFLQYRDDAGTKRRTAFCLHYDAQTDRFDSVDEPNYEYSD